MVAVGGVAVTLMDVVGMVTMADGLMATTFAMAVIVLVVGHVTFKDAFVPVTVMVAVDVAVVEIVGVVAVLHGDVAAPGIVGVTMFAVGLMGCSAHDWCSSRVWSGTE